MRQLSYQSRKYGNARSDPDPVPFRAVDPDQVLFRAVDPVPHGTAFIFLPVTESRRENWKKLKTNLRKLVIAINLLTFLD